MPHPGWSGVSFTGIETKWEISTPTSGSRGGHPELVRVIEYLIDGSSGMLHAGFDPLEVALEHPYDPTRAIGVVTIDGAANFDWLQVFSDGSAAFSTGCKGSSFV